MQTVILKLFRLHQALPCWGFLPTNTLINDLSQQKKRPKATGKVIFFFPVLSTAVR